MALQYPPLQGRRLVRSCNRVETFFVEVFQKLLNPFCDSSDHYLTHESQPTAASQWACSRSHDGHNKSCSGGSGTSSLNMLLAGAPPLGTGGGGVLTSKALPQSGYHDEYDCCWSNGGTAYVWRSAGKCGFLASDLSSSSDLAPIGQGTCNFLLT